MRLRSACAALVLPVAVSKTTDGADRFGAVRGLAHHAVALNLEERPRPGTKPRGVIGDHH
jgi:hypothetical protein